MTYDVEQFLERSLAGHAKRGLFGEEGLLRSEQVALLEEPEVRTALLMQQANQRDSELIAAIARRDSRAAYQVKEGMQYQPGGLKGVVERVIKPVRARITFPQLAGVTEDWHRFLTIGAMLTLKPRNELENVLESQGVSYNGDATSFRRRSSSDEFVHHLESVRHTSRKFKIKTKPDEPLALKYRGEHSVEIGDFVGNWDVCNGLLMHWDLFPEGCSGTEAGMALEKVARGLSEQPHPAIQNVSYRLERSPIGAELYPTLSYDQVFWLDAQEIRGGEDPTIGGSSTSKLLSQDELRQFFVANVVLQAAETETRKDARKAQDLRLGYVAQVTIEKYEL